MERIIVDSGIWQGAFIKKDKWHKNGKKLLEWLDKEKNVLVIVPIGVIYEVIAGILNYSYGGFKKANKALNMFLNHSRLEIYYNTEDLFPQVCKIFERYEILSLVDATIILLYINKSCNVLFSTDSHFDGIPSIKKLEYPIF